MIAFDRRVATEPVSLELHPRPPAADGKLVTCLCSNHGHDLKSLIRSGTTDEQLVEVIGSVWSKRTDRYPDERLAAMNSPEAISPSLTVKSK